MHQSMRLFFLIVFVLIMSDAHAQNNAKKVTYLDKDWQPVKKASEATYYRTVEPQQGKYLVKDFYKATDTIQMEAVCSKVTPTVIQDGPATFYHKNGSIERTGLYAQGLPVGLHKSYYSNGNPRSVNVFKEKEKLIAQYWSATGQPLLINGSGIITEKSEYIDGTVFIEVKDSVQLRGYSVDKSDTIYSHTQTPAEYRGGMESFYRGIAKTVKYPATARRNGVQGRVFVQFIVDKNGVLTDAKVIKGIGSGCDTEALVACLQQKDWLPGSYNGKPIKMLMVLPVTFRLQ
jgi:TonB family protein